MWIADDERAAVWSKARRGRDDIALQNVREVPFGRLGTETMGYVPVHQKLWIAKVNTGGRCSKQRFLTSGLGWVVCPEEAI